MLTAKQMLTFKLKSTLFYLFDSFEVCEIKRCDLWKEGGKQTPPPSPVMIIRQAGLDTGYTNFLFNNETTTTFIRPPDASDLKRRPAPYNHSNVWMEQSLLGQKSIMLGPKRPKRQKLKYINLQIPFILIVVLGIMWLLSWVAIYVISDLREQTTDVNVIYHYCFNSFWFLFIESVIFFSLSLFHWISTYLLTEVPNYGYNISTNLLSLKNNLKNQLL